MSLTVTQGEHTFGPVPGGTPLSPESGLDIGPKAVVKLHCRQRILFIWGDAEVHVHESCDEVFVWGNAKLHVHAPCRVNASGRSRVDVHVKGGMVIATQRANIHVHTDGGVPVHFYDDTQIWAGTGPEICRGSQWALHHTPDGRTIGKTSGYRSQARVFHY